MKKIFRLVNNNKIAELLLVSVYFIMLTIIVFDKIFTVSKYYYFASDISELYFPWWILANRYIHNFILPVRNIYGFMGTDQILSRGDTSILYPLQVFIHLLAPLTRNLNTSYIVFFIQHS